MKFSQAQISTIKQVFTEIVDSKFKELETLIKNIATDTEINKLLAQQQLYLRKDTLTMKEVTEAQLLGRKYTTETVINKLKSLEGCYSIGEGRSKKYYIITSTLIKYRELHGIK